MNDGFSAFLGAVYLIIFACVLGVSWSAGADMVYQECKATGEYRVKYKVIMTCEATK